MSRPTVSRLAQIVTAVRLMLHLLRGVFYVAVVFPHIRRAERDAIISRWSYEALQLFNIRVHVQGDIPPQTATSILFVANHISWLDILALNAFRRVRFVAKMEVRHWPVIGWMAARTGTLFIQRNRPRQLSRLNRSISHALRHGQCVVIFPEGTTTEGNCVLPFHSGLLESALTSKALIWPIALRYSTQEGSLPTSIAFVGDQSLVESMCEVLAQPSVHLQLHFAPPLQVETLTRQQLALQARAAVLARLDDAHRTLPAPPAHDDSTVRWADEPNAAA